MNLVDNWLSPGWTGAKRNEKEEAEDKETIGHKAEAGY